MRAAGVDIVVDNRDIGVVGLWEVLAHAGAVWRAYRTVTHWLERHRPDVVVLIDYPDFHFRIARVAKRLGLRIVYYISPQVWAWRAGRLRTLRRLVDQMIVILPFELPIYRAASIPCALVSHPLLDDVGQAPSRAEVRRGWELPSEQPVIGLFPGSRRGEVRRLLPIMLAAAERLRRAHPQLTVLVSQAATVDDEEFSPLAQRAAVPVIVKRQASTDMLAAVDVAVVASGTITLQAALLETPMVIIYKVAPLSWHIIRRLVRVAYAGLPNLIAGAAIVPELIQPAATPEAIAAVVTRWLTHPEELAAQRKQLAGVRTQLGHPGGSDQAAAVILERAGAWMASNGTGTPA